ncbi:BREX-1 system adenine-specific DNA-methyltransferase PglX [Latilactobacillus sakei]|uniref:BREX-1 system adenine-specific DNA-methyltransferase PglX n=1 Tax=Latilactobacillus sakei TaxID=1599 RepID=UPI003A857271
MGSGHVLAYAFDVFMQLYTAEGFRERDAAELIMTNNLFGLEIDKRAYQLAYFAIMMKGREYNRRILSKEIKLNLHQFIDSPEIPNEYFERLAEVSPYSYELTTTLLNQLTRLLDQFKNTSEIGSILKIEELQQSELDQLDQFIGSFEFFSDMDILYQLPEIQTKVISILNITRVLMTKYTAVTTNPPYLNKMSSNLDKYVKKNYPDVKTDLFSIFIKMNSNILTNGGYAGFMTPFVWMFIKSYEELRSFLITNKSISSLIQMEYSAFEEATVPVCCFMIKNAKTEPVGNYLKLSDFKGGMTVQKEKVLEAIQDNSAEYFYQTNQNKLINIPGSPLSFWVSENIYQNFIEKKISTYGEVKSGIMVNSRYILEWFEVNISDIQLNGQIISDMDDYRWFPLNSGGGFRKWYGNNGPIIDLENNGQRVKKAKNNYRLRNSDYYFKKGITWGRITSSNISFRWSRQGNLFGDAGPMIFIDNDDDLKLILGLSNTKVMLSLTNVLNPTINFQVDDFNNIPVIQNNNYKEKINEIVTTCVEISKLDESFCESSWDFNRNPLV